MKVLNFWFSPVRHYFYSNVACNIVSKYVFVTSTPLVEEMILWPCTFSLSSVLKLILSFCMIICRLEISIKFELSFLSFFVSFCRLLHLYRKICLSKWKNCRSIFISCLNSWRNNGSFLPATSSESYTHIAVLPSSIVKQMKFKFLGLDYYFPFSFQLIALPLADFPNCTDRLSRILKTWVNDIAKLT